MISARRQVMALVVVAASLTLVAFADQIMGQPTAPPAPAAPVPPPEPSPVTSEPDDGGFTPPYPYGQPQAVVPPIEAGKAPLVRRIETDQPYVFITIDDGSIQNPAALDLIRSANVRPTLFLNHIHVNGRAGYFRQLADAGATIQNHTVTHPNLRGKGYEFQKREICGNADRLAAEYGKRPDMLRPPFGNYDETTRKAAADCGMKAIVLWTATVNDGVVQFQAGNRLNPGDIVLMHFRHTFVADFTAFLNQAQEDGLTPVPLEDFLGS